MKYFFYFLAIILIPFLSAIIIFAIPFVTIYFIVALFKPQPAIPESKEEVSFFDFALKNSKQWLSKPQQSA